MTATKVSEEELFRLAFLFAEQDRASFVQCYPENSRDPYCVKARRLVKQLREYRLRRWGKTRFETEMETAKTINVAQAIKRARRV